MPKGEGSAQEGECLPDIPSPVDRMTDYVADGKYFKSLSLNPSPFASSYFLKKAIKLLKEEAHFAGPEVIIGIFGNF